MLDLKNGEEFLDLASGRQMLVKNWSGQTWYFYKNEHTGDWVSLRPVDEEDMQQLNAAYEDMLARRRAQPRLSENVVPLRKISS